MAERLPTSTLLRSGSPAQRDLVRVTFTVSRFLGIGVESAAKKLAEVVRDKAPIMAGSYVVASPEISGGTFVLDMAITKTQSVGRLSRALESIGGKQREVLSSIGIPGAVAGVILRQRLTVQAVERITRSELATGEAERTTERRQEIAEEADEARAERATTLGGIAAGALKTAKLIRGVVILVVIGGALFVAAPFLKTASQALNQLTKKRRRSRG